MKSDSVREIGSLGGHISDRSTVSASHTSVQKEFHRELEAAVRKHSRYLREVEEMANTKLPVCYVVTKRSMDILIGVLGLIMLSPLFLVVSIMVKIDSRGPVFFNQERVGKDHRLFRIHKFRTMVADAEKNTGPTWAIEGDPRLTFIGKFLRKSKIDEFPQFVNLIKGEMTLVGPRPERPFFVDHFVRNIPGYARRLEVTPGITGPAQLRNGYDKRAIDVIKKLRFDITYMKKMRLSMDIGLLVETFVAVLMRKL